MLRSFVRGYCVVAAALALPGKGIAQEFPSKPIHIMVPYETAGTSDLTVRMIQPRMAALLGQPVLIENHPGAGGLTGTEIVAKSSPDGYTILDTFDSFAAVPFLYSNVHHDPVKDFAPITLMVRAPQLLVVDPALGLKTLARFLAYARKKGPELAFSTAGPGSSSRLTMELFKTTAGINPTLVSYKGGGPALSAVMGGHVAGFMSAFGTAVASAKSGKVAALAVSSPKRSPLLPDVPTFAETFPGYEAQSWVGLVVPAATPREIVNRLNSIVVKVLTDPDIKAKFESQGMEVVASTPEEYGRWIAQQVNTWKPIIQSLKIKLD